MNEWFSVKDRLPPLYEFVLVFADNPGTDEPKPISIARTVSQHCIWDLLGTANVGVSMDMEYNMQPWHITHWMPLPKPIK